MASLECSQDPIDLIAHTCTNVTPNRVACDVTELLFSSRRMDALHPNFCEFVNLEVLWIDDNRLVSLDGLVQQVVDEAQKEDPMNGTRSTLTNSKSDVKVMDRKEPKGCVCVCVCVYGWASILVENYMR